MPSESQLRISDGTQGVIEGCRVALFSVTDSGGGAVATLSITVPQSHLGKSFLDVKVRKGDLLPICGGFRRVADVSLSGSRSIIMDKDAVAPAGGGAEEDAALALVPGAIARLLAPSNQPITPIASAELMSITKATDGGVMATFDTWPGGLEKSGAAPGQVTTTTVPPGAELVLQGLRFKVGAVIAPEGGTGLPGFAEVSPTGRE
jgi:hypothetical protein